jgi:hypothetical protein
MQRIAMLGAGLIADFYTAALHGHRGRDRVTHVYSKTEQRASRFAQKWRIPRHSTLMQQAIDDPADYLSHQGWSCACRRGAKRTAMGSRGVAETCGSSSRSRSLARWRRPTL